MALHFLSFRLFSGPHELFATENLTLLFTTTTKNPEIDTLNCKRLVKQSYGKRRMIIHNSILIKKAPKRHFFFKCNDCLRSSRVYYFNMQYIEYCKHYKAWFKQYILLLDMKTCNISSLEWPHIIIYDLQIYIKHLKARSGNDKIVII